MPTKVVANCKQTYGLCGSSCIATAAPLSHLNKMYVIILKLKFTVTIGAYQ